MKSFWAILIFTVTFDCTEGTLMNVTNFNFTSGSQYLGYERRPENCTLEATILPTHVCLTNFIQKLRKDPTSDCSNEFEKYIECAVKAQTCSMMSIEYYKKEINNPHTRELYSRSKFCDKAGQQSIIDPKDSSVMTIGVCKREILLNPFTIKYNNCSEKLVKWWKVNKADKRLCSEYTKVKMCRDNVVKEICRDHGGSYNYTLELIPDNHNPFCDDDVDPTPTPPRSTSTMAWPSFGLVVLSLCYFLSTLSAGQ